MNNDNDNDVLDDAKRVVHAMLTSIIMEDRQPTTEEVRTAANAVAGMMMGQGKQVDPVRLAKVVEAETAVYQETSVGLDDDGGHEPWLSQARADRQWDFWDRYRRYLEDVTGMPPRVVRRLDKSTDEVLGQVEDPRRPGQWRRAGLVIGQVQSGKTGQYIGLVTKAVDAGYGLVVILAGIHNDLRSQTQLRIDEGLLGFDTQFQRRLKEPGKSRLIGVGRMSAAKRLDIACPTNSSETGDFGRAAAATVNYPLGTFPVVLVVKKHWKILDYVKTWVTEVSGIENGTGAKKVNDVALLVVDDEADNASINTKRDPDADPTKTNAAIRELMRSFQKAAYVGYTATPYANIYIDPEVDHAEFGADLFPESFIRALSSPSNYFGPERVFGLRTDDDDADVPPLPLVRPVSDADAWVPPKHPAAFRPVAPLPGSLREAIAAFVLACAARRCRGQVKVHNSMLVHVTRYTDVQAAVRDQVEEYLGLLVDNLGDRYGKSSDRVEELRDVWERDFIPTTIEFPDQEASRLNWEQVREQLLPAIRKIEVKAINGTSKDALDYYENRRSGLSVIAVGGQKLSRGLTLEGLTVSYYLRSSSTYDTLLQMGRWFGYRPKYEDMCRLYTTSELQAAYVEVTSATHELRREIEEMAALGLTPKEFGLKVRSSSLGLTITAPNKMRSGTRVMLSYSGEGPETTLFDTSAHVVQRNLAALNRLITRLDGSTAVDLKPGRLLWRKVRPDEISRFLNEYVTDRQAHRVRPKFIAKYIDNCAGVGELSSWTVCLVNKVNPSAEDEIAGRSVGRVTRRNLAVKGSGRHVLRRVGSPRDEGIDLDPDQLESALRAAEAEARKNGKRNLPKRPTGIHLRRLRTPDQALLTIYLVEQAGGDEAPEEFPLVGFQVSFPRSEHITQTEYVVNSIWNAEDIDHGMDGDDE